jgi:tRNA threonylcarbamoyl adenosine modification protein YeaZ
MKILAVDTSSKICAVAVLEDEKVIDEIILDNGKTHSENLMPILKECLEKNNLELKDMNLIAVSVGPGSFTGIRIGIASIKPIAEVMNLPVASVTSLETLAKNVDVLLKNSSNEINVLNNQNSLNKEENSKSEDLNKEKIDINNNSKLEENKDLSQAKDVTILSLIDAKNNQVYAGFFDENCNLKEEEIAEDIFEVLEKAKKYKSIICVGDGAILHKEKIEEYLKEAKIEVNFVKNNSQSAANTGKIGFKKFEKNDLKNADTILPIYLRKSQAERLKK